MPPRPRPPAIVIAALVAAFTTAASRGDHPPPTPPAKAPPAVAKAAQPPLPKPPAPPPPPPPVALPATDLPAGPIYFCDKNAERTPIEFEPRVEELCRRHPEMGPCQYERNACRKAGGRVYTSKNEEVTLAVEARYDQRVQRVTLQGDSGAAKKK